MELTGTDAERRWHREYVDGIKRVPAVPKKWHEMELEEKIDYIIIEDLIINKTTMDQATFEAGMTAAIQAYYNSLSGAYPVSAFTYNYTPVVTTPPSDTVSVSL